MTDLAAARALLRENFGHDDFLPGQAEAVAAALEGADLFVLRPTGAGKSLVFQLPALARPGLTLVVSPLVALMRDQAQKLARRGIPAAALHADLEPDAWRRLCAGLDSGRLKLLYLAPERLAEPETIALLRHAGVRTLAVDEAHCISQWGHDFRPEYRRIAAFADDLGQPQIIAPTATASPRTREDILKNLFARPPRLFVGSFRRPSVALSAVPQARDRLAQLVQLATQRRGRSGIVYCASRATADRLAAILAGAGLPSAAYHAGLAADVRAERQDAFLAGSDMVMAATIAFGLGVDKPDVRYVIHYDPPDHLETLYQETGRAGRDGAPAEAIALYGVRDMAKLRAARFDLDGVDPAAGRRARAVSAYFCSALCREQVLLAALGEAATPCGRCDNCRKGAMALRQRLRRAAEAPAEIATFARHGFGLAVAALLPRVVAEAPEEGEALPMELGAEAPDARPSAAGPLTVEQLRRLRALRAARIAAAREAGLAPGALIADKVLIRLAVAPPANVEELAAHCGDEMGLLVRFGGRILEAARVQHC
jgi:ATP-dependent DNA helicase RecQ